jgi:DNA-binding winged helix-turn-helix (wHTH) protein
VRLQFGEFLLDTDARQLFKDGVEVRLQPKTFDLLHLLLRSRPKALSKQAIRDQVWPDVVVGEASLTVAVAELRAALGDDAKEPRFVRTVYGFGYAFAGEVVEADAGSQRPAGRRNGAPAPRLLWERRVIPLLDGENVIGRDEGVAVRIDVPGVSRRHARIVIEGERASVEDLGSKNGTYLGGDGEPVQSRMPLSDGARLRFGSVVTEFRSGPEAGATVTERDA